MNINTKQRNPQSTRHKISKIKGGHDKNIKTNNGNETTQDKTDLK